MCHCTKFSSHNDLVPVICASLLQTLFVFCLRSVLEIINLYIKYSIYIYVHVYIYRYTMCNKPTRCNSHSIVFINNCKYALHVSDALCVHHQEHYKL